MTLLDAYSVIAGTVGIPADKSFKAHLIAYVVSQVIIIPIIQVLADDTL